MLHTFKYDVVITETCAEEQVDAATKNDPKAAIS
jgi:hypothetical protein